MKAEKYCMLCGNKYEMDFGLKRKKRNSCPVCGFTVRASNDNNGHTIMLVDRLENNNLAPMYMDMLKNSWFWREE